MKRQDKPGRKNSRPASSGKSSYSGGKPVKKRVPGGEKSAPRPYKKRSGSEEGFSSEKPARRTYGAGYTGDDKPKRAPYKTGAASTRAPRRDDDSGERKSFSDRENRPPKSFDKSERGSSRPYVKRDDRPARPSRDGDDRPRKSFDKPDRADSRPYVKRDDRPARPSSDRDDRPSRPRSDSDDRPRKSFDKPDRAGSRPYVKRDDRSTRPSSDRDERPLRPSRDSDDRPRKSFDKPDRAGSRPYVKRDERPARPSSDREDRPLRPSRDGDDRPRKSFDKPDRGSARPYVKRDERPARPSSDREDRPRKTFDKEENRPRIAYDKLDPKSGKSYGKKPKRSADVFEESATKGAIRLNRYISMAGICSRREADAMIEAGLFKVNGFVVTELGTKVNPGDDVRYNGERIKNEKPVYLLLNKPKDYITTMDDPGQRHTVMELVANACSERIYPVGRLDRNTTGLLLFTNDGDLAKTLTHPSSSIRKIYHAELDKSFKVSDMKKLVEGVELEEVGFMQVDDISYDGDGSDKKAVGLEIHSGQNRIVRRMFEHLGYDVRKLDRVVFAGLTKKNIPRGRWRFLTENEVSMLKMISSKKSGKAFAEEQD